MVKLIDNGVAAVSKVFNKVKAGAIVSVFAVGAAYTVTTLENNFDISGAAGETFSRLASAETNLSDGKEWVRGFIPDLKNDSSFSSSDYNVRLTKTGSPTGAETLKSKASLIFGEQFDVQKTNDGNYIVVGNVNGGCDTVKERKFDCMSI